MSTAQINKDVASVPVCKYNSNCRPPVGVPEKVIVVQLNLRFKIALPGTTIAAMLLRAAPVGIALRY